MKSEISIKNILRLSTPASIYYATIVLVGVIDLLFISKFGTIAIAATALSVTICTTLYNFIDGIRISTTVLVAQFLGAKDERNIARTLTAALISAIVLGLASLPLAPHFSNLIFKLIGNPEIYSLGYSYLSIRIISLTPILITFSIIGFFRGLQNTVFQLIVAFAICLSNIVLDYILIFGNLGFSPMGVKGAAIATLLAETIGAIISVIALFISPLTKNIISIKAPSLPLYKKHTKISLESGLYAGTTYLAISTFAFFLGKLSTQTLAVYQIGSQIFLINFLPQFGFFVAASIIVGKLFGTQNYNLIPKAAIKISAICFSAATILSIATYFFGPTIIKLFCPEDPIVLQGVMQILIFICADQLISSLCLVLRGCLTGINETRFIAIVNFITGYIIFLPLAYFLGVTLKFGLIGGYTAFIVWGVLELLLYSSRLLTRGKRLKQFNPSFHTSKNPSLKVVTLTADPTNNSVKQKEKNSNTL